LTKLFEENETLMQIVNDAGTGFPDGISPIYKPKFSSKNLSKK